MKTQMVSYLMLASLWATTAVAQVTDIRKVDFLNFSYRSSLCSQEYGKAIGKEVRVSNGEFKDGNVYLTVAADRILYADVNGDGHEDALVPLECGAVGANFARSEVHVYALKNGRAVLLASVDDKVMERDYRRNYRDAESYWGIAENGLKVKDGNLEIDVLADGPHASPQHVVTLEYHLRGAKLRLIGKPQRKNAK